MKVPFRQLGKTGCGSYALANIFNEERFIECLPEEKGESLWDQNVKMAEFMPDWYAGTLFQVPLVLTKQENRLLDPIVFSYILSEFTQEQIDCWAGAFLVSIQGLKRCHCVSVALELSTGLLHVLDGLKEEIEVISPEDFLRKYHVLTVERFFSTKNDDTLYLIKSGAAHIFSNDLALHSY